MTNKQSSLRSRVKHLLFLDQRFRDDNRYLILKVWEQDGLILDKWQRAIYMELPSADVIMRRRRDFNSAYPASPAILEKRFHHFKEFHAEYSPQNFMQRLLRRHHV